MSSAITFDRFDSGLDLRKGASVSDANRLRELDNAYVTTGRTIRKRPGLELVTTLESGTLGLTAAGGKLNTFYSIGTVTHADARFVANKIAYPNVSPSYGLKKVLFADVFNGYLYVAAEYWDGSIFHHYLNPTSTEIVWGALAVYTLGMIRRPTVDNGLRYEVTTAGTSAGVEPTWPTTIGATVTDGTVVWKCRSTLVTDSNCPQSGAVVKKSQKIFAIDDDVVRFCATGNPRDWTTASDAGFLGVGTQQSGATNPSALGEYAGNLVVFFNDSSQVWAVDPDPANMRFVQSLDVGCPFPNGAANMAGDVFFASYDGVRSITTQTQTGNLMDVDVGSPIDSLATTSFVSGASVKSFFFRGGGQFWAAVGNVAYVYSFSRTSKISAWSRYTFPFDVIDVAELNGDLYFRSGNNVYRFTEDATTDAGTPIGVRVVFPYLDFKAPGLLKQITGMDAVFVGTADIAHRFDASQPAFETPAYPVTGDSRPGGMLPVEICTTGIAPIVTHSADEAFEMHALTYYYDVLGAQ